MLDLLYHAGFDLSSLRDPIFTKLRDESSSIEESLIKSEAVQALLGEDLWSLPRVIEYVKELLDSLSSGADEALSAFRLCQKHKILLETTHVTNLLMSCAREGRSAVVRELLELGCVPSEEGREKLLTTLIAHDDLVTAKMVLDMAKT